MRHSTTLLAATVALLCHGQPSHAQTTGIGGDPLHHAVERALATNPEMTARFNTYRAAGDAVDAARGGLLPRWT